MRDEDKLVQLPDGHLNKTPILIGLMFYIAGCVLFFPASHMATYTMFLFAIFSIAIGLGFLETAANTYSTMIGSRKHATLRLNISQTFYPIGAVSGILLGKYLIFQEGDSLASQIAQMTAELTISSATPALKRGYWRSFSMSVCRSPYGRSPFGWRFR